MAIEYETIGVIFAITGLISYQLRYIDKKNDREHDKLWKAVVKIANHVGVNLNKEVNE